MGCILPGTESLPEPALSQIIWAHVIRCVPEICPNVRLSLLFDASCSARASLNVIPRVSLPWVFLFPPWGPHAFASHHLIVRIITLISLALFIDASRGCS